MTEQSLTPEQADALAEAHAKADAEEAKVTPIRPSTEVVAAPRLEITTAQTWWTPAQQAALATIGLDESVPDEHKLAFLHLAQRTGLDPFARELYLIGRKDNQAPGGMRYTAQTGIDGFRTLAERTGEYGGKVATFWCGPDGKWVDVWLEDEPPKAARVGIIRKGFPEPVWGIAVYREYVQMKPVYRDRVRTGEEVPAAMWAKMPAHMLAKCAEALAIRQAFPRQAGGIYTDDEMGVADAAAERAAYQEAQAIRAQQRADLARRPWGTEQASPALTADGEVVEGEVVDGEVLPTVEELRAELTEQATILKTTPQALARRAVALHRKNLEEFTATELLPVIEANRAAVAQTLAVKVADTAAAAAVPAETAPEQAEDAVSEPAAPKATKRTRKPKEAVSDDPAVVNPDAPHTFVPFEAGACLICGLTETDPIHTGT